MLTIVIDGYLLRKQGGARGANGYRNHGLVIVIIGFMEDTFLIDGDDQRVFACGHIGNINPLTIQCFMILIGPSFRYSLMDTIIPTTETAQLYKERERESERERATTRTGICRQATEAI